MKQETNMNWFKLAKEEDQYTDAVKAGDRPKAADLVRRKAMESGYGIGPVHHGSPTSGFNQFKIPSRGAEGYGKTVVRFELPLEWVEVTKAGEFQYKGPAKSLGGGSKWPPEIYRAYNDYWGSNFTAAEIDSQDDVARVAAMALDGGRDEFKKLVGKWEGRSHA